MWDFKYKPIKKTVEARTRAGGVDVLLTVNAAWTKLSMNGGAHIRPHEWDTFASELAEAGKTARAILESQ